MKKKAKKQPKKEKIKKKTKSSPKTVKKPVFQAPKGTRDIMPREMEARSACFDTINKVFKQYGYGHVQTPAFESLELLTCKDSLGDEAVKDIYRFTDKSDRQLGLRYDPTTPIARIVAANPDIPKPIRWCYITNMWRYEDTGAGRYREFWQAGIELMGSSSIAADAEVIGIVIEALLSLGLENFTVRVNSRQVLDNIARRLKLKDDNRIFKAIDKLSRKGEAAVKEELKSLGLESKKINELMKFIKTDPAKLRKFPGVRDLEKIINLLDENHRKFVSLDFSVVRGLDYYTGMIFETFVSGHENMGSVASGGRYDNLIEKFGGKPTPSVGVGIGVDRLIQILEEEDLVKKPKKRLIFLAPVSHDVLADAVKICHNIRSNENIVELGFPEKNLSKLLEYAGKKNASFAVIVGPNDLKDENVTIRDMKSGEEVKAPIRDIIEEIRKWERTKLFF